GSTIGGGSDRTRGSDTRSEISFITASAKDDGGALGSNASGSGASSSESSATGGLDGGFDAGFTGAGRSERIFGSSRGAMSAFTAGASTSSPPGVQTAPIAPRAARSPSTSSSSTGSISPPESSARGDAPSASFCTTRRARDRQRLRGDLRQGRAEVAVLRRDRRRARRHGEAPRPDAEQRREHPLATLERPVAR